MIEMNQIILADCMDIMKDIPDKYFELAIVDPPYGIGIFTYSAHTDSKGKRIKNNKKAYNDDYTWNNNIPAKKYFNELKRISKKRVIWGANYYNCFENGKGALIWDKGEMTKTISQCEIASLSFQTKVSYIKINWQSGFYRVVKENKQIHPCQKPVALYKWLLKNYANEGDKILDTHSGSGTTAIACIDMGFEYLCIERDLDYYTKSVERVNKELIKIKLF